MACAQMRRERETLGCSLGFSFVISRFCGELPLSNLKVLTFEGQVQPRHHAKKLLEPVATRLTWGLIGFVDQRKPAAIQHMNWAVPAFPWALWLFRRHAHGAQGRIINPQMLRPAPPSGTCYARCAPRADAFALCQFTCKTPTV